MAEPKRKTSKSRRNNRRSHHALNETINVLKCKKCGNTVKPHTLCPECNTYPGKDRTKNKSESKKSDKK